MATLDNNKIQIINEIRELRTRLNDDGMIENTRRARRMMLLFSFIGIVWSIGIEIRKMAPGGIEVYVTPELIPLALMTLIFFFGFQFYLYQASDFGRLIYMWAELRRTSYTLGYICGHEGAQKDAGKKEPEDMDFPMEKALFEKEESPIDIIQIIGWPRMIWDYYLPTIIALVAVVGLAGRLLFGWFAIASAAPLIPHIPAWAPLWQ